MVLLLTTASCSSQPLTINSPINTLLRPRELYKSPLHDDNLSGLSLFVKECIFSTYFREFFV